MPVVETLSLGELLQLLIVIANRIQNLTYQGPPPAAPPRQPPLRQPFICEFHCQLCQAPCNRNKAGHSHHRCGAHPLSLRGNNLDFRTPPFSDNGTCLDDSIYPGDLEPISAKRSRMSAPSKAQSGTKSDTLVKVKQSSSSAIVLRLWSQIVELLAPHSQLIRDIMLCVFICLEKLFYIFW